MFLAIAHTPNVQVMSNSGYGSIPWQSVPPVNQKELPRQVTNEELELQC